MTPAEQKELWKRGESALEKLINHTVKGDPKASVETLERLAAKLESGKLHKHPFFKSFINSL